MFLLFLFRRFGQNFYKIFSTNKKIFLPAAQKTLGPVLGVRLAHPAEAIYNMGNAST